MPFSLALANIGYTAFIPNTISGLQLWLKADTGVTLVSGAVSAWADQSGVGDGNRNATQSTAARRPTYNAADAAYNSRPTTSYALASLSSISTGTWSPALSQPCTIIMAAHNSASDVGDASLLDGESSRVLIAAKVTSRFAEYFAGTSVITSTTAVSSPSIIAAIANGASSHLYVNNSQTPVANGNPGASGLDLVHLGCYSGSAGAGNFDGTIAEVLAYNTALSSDNLKSVFAYLGAKYGISVS